MYTYIWLYINLIFYGKNMSVRDKGPLWLVYPRHMNAQFGNDKYNARWIWQIATNEVQ